METCPKCKRNTVRIQVSLYLDIHPRVYGRLSKKNLRTRDVRVQGAGWPTMVLYCTRVECGHMVRFK